MSYSLHRLAPGSYDVLRQGEIIASLVNAPFANGRARWFAELLDVEAAERPPPFSNEEHEFGSLAAACELLGVAPPK